MEAVRAVLITTNIERVMAVLRRRFGRAEFIIEELMTKILNSPNVKEDRPITLIKFAEAVTNLVTTCSLDQPAYLTNHMPIKQLISKLPATERMSWEKRTAKIKHGTDLVEFAS